MQSPSRTFSSETTGVSVGAADIVRVAWCSTVSRRAFARSGTMSQVQAIGREGVVEKGDDDDGKWKGTARSNTVTARQEHATANVLSRLTKEDGLVKCLSWVSWDGWEERGRGQFGQTQGNLRTVEAKQGNIIKTADWIQ